MTSKRGKSIRFAEDDAARTESITPSQASVSTADTKPKQQPKVERARATTSEYRISRMSKRVTHMFDSLSINRARQSIYVRPTLQFLPTFQLTSNKPFDPPAVRELVEEAVENFMNSQGKIKFSKSVINLCRSLSEEVLGEVKLKNFNRYRILVSVTAGEQFHQNFRQSAMCLWDSETDALVNYVYERPDIFVITTVFGIYYD